MDKILWRNACIVNRQILKTRDKERALFSKVNPALDLQLRTWSNSLLYHFEAHCLTYVWTIYKLIWNCLRINAGISDHIFNTHSSHRKTFLLAKDILARGYVCQEHPQKVFCIYCRELQTQRPASCQSNHLKTGVLSVYMGVVKTPFKKVGALGSCSLRLPLG